MSAASAPRGAHATTRSCALAAMGVVSALGSGRAETWPRLLAADQSGFRRRDDLVPGRSLLVACVT
ncbi:MAG TPA: hypothetical protein VEC18_01520, partial [Myxococcota bacterium]|nr:hypothetical protein [Myxococcota bacterium]